MLSQLVNRIGSSRGCYSGEQVPSLTPDNSERRAAISDIGSNTALTFRFWFPHIAWGITNDADLCHRGDVLGAFSRGQLGVPLAFQKKIWGGNIPTIENRN